jgi:hypothetical protein
MDRSRSIAATALVLGLSGCGASSEPQSRPTTSPPAQTALPVTDEPTPIEPGRYRLPRDPWAVTDYSVTIPAGWTLQYGHVFAKHPDTAAEYGFYGVTVDEVFSHPCVGDSPTTPVAPGLEALVTALRTLHGPVLSDPVETTLGGRRAIRVDVATPKRWTACPNLDDGVGLRIWLSVPADKNLLVEPGTVKTLYLVEVPTGRQVFVTGAAQQTPAAERAELPAVLDSIRIPG